MIECAASSIIFEGRLAETLVFPVRTRLTEITGAHETYFQCFHKWRRKWLNRAHLASKICERKKLGLLNEQVPLFEVRDRTNVSGSLAVAAKEKGVERHALNLTAAIRVIALWHV